MENTIKFAHVNLIARNWKKLADFYIRVFGCEPLPPERDLKGKWLEEITGVKKAHLKGIHLRLPGYPYGGPTLEIFEYAEWEKNAQPRVPNRPGYGHISFHVDSVEDTLQSLISHGGKRQGTLIRKEYPGTGLLTAVYCTDSEGNFLEIQNWQKEPVRRS